jgi:hypothetical protein
MLSSLKIKSENLDIEDGLQWIQNILPDVPSYLDQSKTQVTFMY